ncbi:MAG: hypothetical protein CL910_03145 [Deltaproteobacteria bacterium]|jgi:hypothetical protein|nr:hypothetical protein [Deltaproteobacteria bacterium]
MVYFFPEATARLGLAGPQVDHELAVARDRDTGTPLDSLLEVRRECVPNRFETRLHESVDFDHLQLPSWTGKPIALRIGISLVPVPQPLRPLEHLLEVARGDPPVLPRLAPLDALLEVLVDGREVVASKVAEGSHLVHSPGWGLIPSHRCLT